MHIWNGFWILTFKVVNYLIVIVDSSTDTEDKARDMVSIWKFLKLHGAEDRWSLYVLFLFNYYSYFSACFNSWIVLSLLLLVENLPTVLLLTVSALWYERQKLYLARQDGPYLVLKLSDDSYSEHVEKEFPVQGMLWSKFT